MTSNMAVVVLLVSLIIGLMGCDQKRSGEKGGKFQMAKPENENQQPSRESMEDSQDISTGDTGIADEPPKSVDDEDEAVELIPDISNDSKKQGDHEPVVVAQAPSEPLMGEAPPEPVVADKEEAYGESIPEPPSGSFCNGGASGLSGDWAQGVNGAPLTSPLKTGGVHDKNLVYTDSHRDSLMEKLVGKVDAMPTFIQTASKVFALKIGFVKMQVTGRTVQVNLDVFKNERYEVTPVQFFGIFDDKIKTKAILDETDNSNKKLAISKYKAELTCIDKVGTCKSMLLTLNEVDAKGVVKATAFIVQRQGDAEINLESSIAAGESVLKNEAQKEFAAFLTGTMINSCLIALDGHDSSKVLLEACVLERMRVQCDGLKQQTVAAKSTYLRTWAVAYGRAAFKLAFDDANGKFDLELSGPLVYSATQRPMIGNDMIHKDGAFKRQLGSAEIIANDGGGKLNFRLSFAGQPSGTLRLNVTMLAPEVIP